MDNEDFRIFQDAQTEFDKILQSYSHAPLPDPQSIAKAANTVYDKLPEHGHGFQKISDHLLRDVVPGLNGSSLSPTYYGFVTGGITPAARLADGLVTLFDQNVSVHLPKETISTIIEDRGIRMLLELLQFEPQQWPIHTLSTGATASNLLGLACGREYVVSQKLASAGQQFLQDEGLLSSCKRAGIDRFQVLTTLPHSSLGKAANIVGLGSASMIDVSKDGRLLDFDMTRLEAYLAAPEAASIVVISCGEINTGLFATNSIDEVRTIRRLCERYGAWLHVDGAFGLLARALPDDAHYGAVRAGTAGLELADSIGGDGHKLVNVPYDCGFFFCRHRDISIRVFQNTNAAYLSGDPSEGIVSPLSIRIENSARFRALPLYATLAAYGRVGYSAMIAKMVDLARKIARFIRDDCPHLELLPRMFHKESLHSIYMCVLFRAVDRPLNGVLAEKIKETRRVYASGTQWEGEPAVRFAIAKWDVDVDRDFAVVKEVLEDLA